MGLSTEPRPVGFCATSAPSCSGSSTELCRGIRKFSLARFYPGLFRSAARAGLAGLLRICDGAAKLHSLRVRQLRCDLSAADPCPAGTWSHQTARASSTFCFSVHTFHLCRVTYFGRSTRERHLLSIQFACRPAELQSGRLSCSNSQLALSSRWI